MRKILFTSLLFLVLPFAAPLSANAVTESGTKLIQPRAVQYQVIDRKSQPQVLEMAYGLMIILGILISILVYQMVTDL